MYAWSTPDLTIRIRGRDLTEYTVTLGLEQRRGRTVIANMEIPDESLTKRLDGEDTIIGTTLTQEQTGKLSDEVTVDLQINAVSSLGKRLPTKTKTLKVERNLIRHALSYEGGDDVE